MATMDQKKQVITDFLRKCNEYSDGMIAKYQARLDGANGADALALQDQVSHWSAYRAFNEYTIEELKTDEIDDWFDEIGE